MKEEKLTCPICEKGFQDMRGLNSHARQIHGLDRDEIITMCDNREKKEKDKTNWGLIGGFGAILLAIITAGRFR